MKAIFRVFIVIISALMVIWWLNVPFLDTGRDKSSSIVVTTPFLEDIILELLGPDANVTLLIERGQNPLTVAESPNVANQIKDADILVMHGTFMDGPYQTIQDLTSSTTTLINVRDLLPDNSTASDYFWLNMLSYSKVVSLMNSRLKQLLPNNRSELDYRANAYTKKIYDAYQFAIQNFKSQLAMKGVIATNHPSLLSLTTSLGINCVVLPVPDAPSEDDLLLLVKELRDKKINIIFPNQQFPLSGINALESEAFDYDQPVQFALPVQTLTLNEKGSVTGSVLDLFDSLVRSLING